MGLFSPGQYHRVHRRMPPPAGRTPPVVPPQGSPSCELWHLLFTWGQSVAAMNNNLDQWSKHGAHAGRHCRSARQSSSTSVFGPPAVLLHSAPLARISQLDVQWFYVLRLHVLKQASAGNVHSAPELRPCRSLASTTTAALGTACVCRACAVVGTAILPCTSAMQEGTRTRQWKSR